MIDFGGDEDYTKQDAIQDARIEAMQEAAEVRLERETEIRLEDLVSRVIEHLHSDPDALAAFYIECEKQLRDRLRKDLYEEAEEAARDSIRENTP